MQMIFVYSNTIIENRKTMIYGNLKTASQAITIK